MASWIGSLNVDNISIPIKLHPIIKEDGIKLSFACPEHNSKVNQAYICEEQGHILFNKDMSRVYFDGKELMPITPEEIEVLTVESDKTLEILEVRAVDDFPWHMVRGAYAIEADKGFTTALESLLEALWQMKAIAVGKFNMRGKENLCALREDGRLLLLHWPNEVSHDLFTDAEIDTREVEKFHKILVNMTKASDTEVAGGIEDPYVERLIAIVSNKVTRKIVKEKLLVKKVGQ